MNLIDTLISELKRARDLDVYLDNNSNSVSNFKSSRNSTLISSINSLIDQIEKINPDTGLIISRMRKTRDTQKLIELAHKLPLTEERISRIKAPLLVSDEINADWKEANDCFENQLFRSCVIICGRLLEIALHAKYYLTTNVDLLEKAPGIGLGNLIAKLSDKGAFVDPGLSNQIHLINQVRIHSVHKKQKPFFPSRNQAKAIMLYTKDAIEKLFY